MVDRKYLNQEVVNKEGERGVLFDIDDDGILSVAYSDRTALYLDNAFEKGYLEFVNVSTKEETKMEECIHNISSLKDRLKEPLEELNSLIGLKNVKSQINDLVCQIKIANYRKAMSLRVPDTTNHMVFVGNPGTGKTTVARIVAKILKELEVISSGHLVEVDRSQLIAAYQGQTAIKTKKVLTQALGGVLFIDEAYAVCRGDRDEYGQEAIDTITKYMEDHRDNLVVIAAGYEKEMYSFLETNPGLSSRFKTFITFDDYQGDELYRIFFNFFKDNDYKLSKEAEEAAKEHFQKNSFCSNARDVRNMFEMSIKKQAERLNEIEDITRDDLVLILKEDLAFIS